VDQFCRIAGWFLRLLIFFSFIFLRICQIHLKGLLKKEAIARTFTPKGLPEKKLTGLRQKMPGISK
jgi:hypothetical protein